MRNSRKVAAASPGYFATWYTNNSPLANSLTGYWKLNEVSGDALPSVGASTLTDTNTVTSNPGKVYSLARQFTIANSELLTAADTAAVSTGDITFWAAAWFYLDAKPALAQQAILTKGYGTGAQAEYLLYYGTTPDSCMWGVSDDGVTLNTALTFGGAVSLSTWAFVLVYHNATTNTFGGSVNNSNLSATAWTTGVRDGTGDFRIGGDDTPVTPTNYFGGRIGPVMFGKSYMPTQQDVAFLYNNGLGRP